ncbi:zonular occludens toxin family protein [Marinobacter sp. SS21]|uniref:zonular occludens toxin family protein n=1 Tax=Marinobacter sp. SS21 TaxID=2979460 RepID=UPI00232EDB15|nr:zonular occludens toxin domain-containing protein [Marinobacter sp. SS21]MDC0664356.1 zonular occludens toxin domain-containing protein [Marinobacter sp. SS21]
MTINIHHGPPGSYKSAGVVQRYVIPALTGEDDNYPDGRTVVTNIRGLDSLERIEEAFGVTCGPDARIINLETETRDALEYAARWFHWAPIGALIVLDEAQAVYPAARRDFRIESLDYPGGKEAAQKDSRPADLLLAFDMHRHYNWDLFLCTPNIGKIHREIRQSAQQAFRHWQMGHLVPWKKNKWRELEHDPENSGKSASHSLGVAKEYKVDLRVFDCYQSTKTGKAQGVVGGHSILKDRKLQMLFVVIVGCISYFSYAMFEIVEREKIRLQGNDVDAGPLGTPVDRVQPDGGDGGDLPADGPPQRPVIDHPLEDARIEIAGSVNRAYLLTGNDDQGEFSLTQADLASYGYRVLYLRPCHGQLWWEGENVQDLYCQRNRIRKPEPRPTIEPDMLNPFMTAAAPEQAER